MVLLHFTELSNWTRLNFIFQDAALNHRSAVFCLPSKEETFIVPGLTFLVKLDEFNVGLPFLIGSVSNNTSGFRLKNFYFCQ